MHTSESKKTDAHGISPSLYSTFFPFFLGTSQTLLFLQLTKNSYKKQKKSAIPTALIYGESSCFNSPCICLTVSFIVKNL